MRLHVGYIYLFKYFNYKRDRQPLVLVLYQGIHPTTGNHIIHGININYLRKDLTTDLIEMLTQIATKQLDARNMYRFYHSYMKKKIHPIIAKAYRIYLVTYLGKPYIVSRGFNETHSFLSSLIMSKTRSENKIKTKLTDEIMLGKEYPENAKTLSENRSTSVGDVLDNVKNYFNQIKEHLNKPKFDKRNYTGIHRRK